MLKKLMGLGFLVLLLSFPLQADHKHRRSRYDRGHHYRGGYIEIHVGSRHGHGSFVRGFRPARRHYRGFDDHHRRGKRFKKFKRRYFKRHRHYHYDGYCPY